jgi:hypothetical protein
MFLCSIKEVFPEEMKKGKQDGEEEEADYLWGVTYNYNVPT